MNAAVNKLAIKLGNRSLATALVSAGLTTPGAIKRASDDEIKAAVGSENVSAVRGKFKKQGK